MEVNEKQLKAIYNENYFKGNEYFNYLADKPTIQKNFAKRLKQVHINPKSYSEINVLEIGCAYGFFGEVFIDNFKNAKYTGIDVVSEAVNYGKSELGLNLIFKDYLTFSTSEKYSHVFMWDVIEHLLRPDLFIEKISREILKEGELHITTGDISSFLPKIQKKNWRMIHPPSHLHYFTKKTIVLLLNNNGFGIKKITYNPVYRSIKQIFYSLFLLNKPSHGIIRKMFEIIPDRWFIPLNTYDIMHIVAVKR
jgi:2-polyprenyl-3-methyl-5-hydroxy-6-metoxy-1,4-benzoquinol methylase